MNLASALLQALVVGWLLSALGIRRALFVMPLVVLAGWFGLLLFANLTMVRIEKPSENSLDYSLHNTLRQALFLPITRAAKYGAKAAIDTFFFRTGDVIAGLGIVSTGPAGCTTRWQRLASRWTAIRIAQCPRVALIALQ